MSTLIVVFIYHIPVFNGNIHVVSCAKMATKGFSNEHLDFETDKPALAQ